MNLNNTLDIKSVRSGEIIRHLGSPLSKLHILYICSQYDLNEKKNQMIQALQSPSGFHIVNVTRMKTLDFDIYAPRYASEFCQ
jgi:hypothetical protein